MTNQMISIIVVTGVVIIIGMILQIKKHKKQLEQYQGIIDIDEEIQRKKAQLKKQIAETEKTKKNLHDSLDRVERDIDRKKIDIELLQKELDLYSDNSEMLSFGIYEPQWDLDTSVAYKEEIRKNKEKQKLMIKAKGEDAAFYCDKEWVVGTSKAEGRKMTQRGIKLTARAFNGEVDSLIAQCKWNNFDKIQKRIWDAAEKIDKLNEVNRIFINYNYVGLRIEELSLTHEYHEKKQQEKEEQAEIREQMREEKRVEDEIRKAQEDAEREEKAFQRALDKATKEADKAQGEKLDSLNQKIAQLKFDLEMAQLKGQRALSMAQQTKSGHVYVISNLGSFGENVYKIGMTRRLDPNDRVKELGDASVPFSFDVHAMIKSDDAPKLEKLLHKKFDNARVNKINKRKEFFNVSLEEIEDFISEHHDADVEFQRTMIAEQFRQSVA